MSFPLKQTVKNATRQKNILDKIYTNIACHYDRPFILPPIGNSDHNVVIFNAVSVLYNCIDKPHVRISVVRSRDPNGKTLLAEALRTYDWSSLYHMSECESMASYFYGTICELLNYYLPLYFSKSFSTDKPWVDDNFRLLIKRHQYAWQHNMMSDYKSLRNQVQRAAVRLRIAIITENVSTVCGDVGLGSGGKK